MNLKGMRHIEPNKLCRNGRVNGVLKPSEIPTTMHVPDTTETQAGFEPAYAILQTAT